MSLAPGRRQLAAAALGVVACGVAWNALADEPREPLKVEYRREGMCPDADAFFAKVQARTSKVRAAKAGERARTLSVWVSEAKPDSVGTLSIVGDDGATTTSTRSVRATTCGDVVEALSLIAALAVDPSASTAAVALPSATAPSSPASAGPASAATTATPTPSAAPPTASVAPPSASASPPAASATPPTTAGTTTAPVGSAPPSASTSPPPPSGDATPRRIGFAVGAGMEGATLFGGRLAYGGTLQVDVDRPGPWSPMLVVRATRTFAGEVEASGRRGALTQTTGSLEPCPVRWRPSSTLAVFPCVRVAAGWVTAEGKRLATPEASTRTWVDVGAGLRAAWRPWHALSLEPHVGLRVPLTRDRFYVPPDATVYRVPAVAAGGGIDALFHFP